MSWCWAISLVISSNRRRPAMWSATRSTQADACRDPRISNGFTRPHTSAETSGCCDDWTCFNGLAMACRRTQINRSTVGWANCCWALSTKPPWRNTTMMTEVTSIVHSAAGSEQTASGGVPNFEGRDDSHFQRVSKWVEPFSSKSNVRFLFDCNVCKLCV